VVLVHGEADEVVPVAQGRSAARVLERAGIDVTFVERDTGHVLAPLLDAAHGLLVARG
jgi:predicted esterase